MPDVLEELVRRTNSLEQQVEELRARERFIAFDYDYARGWRDDFLGDSLHDQYSAITGLISLVDGKHGGWIRANATTNNNYSARLELGEELGPPFYHSLDIDEGWVMVWRMELDSVTNIQGGAVAFEWTNQYRIFAGLHTDIHANNWIIRCWNAAGNSFTNTGVVADTDPHWHLLRAYPVTGGHQVDYFLDGSLIGSHTTNIYNGFLHPILWCINRGGSLTDRIAEFDFWGVIPRNI